MEVRCCLLRKGDLREFRLRRTADGASIMNIKEVGLLTAMVLATAGGQLLLRRGVVDWETGKGVKVFLRSAVFSWASPAAVLVMGAPFLYWRALETVPLSWAYAFSSLTGVFVQIGGKLLLGERVSRRFLAGALMCCGGIALWGI